MNARQAVDVFIRHGIIHPDQADDVLQEVTNTGKSIAQVLVDMEFVSRENFYQIIAEELGAEYIDLATFEASPEIQRLIPAGMAKLHGVLPIGMSGGAIVVAPIDPLNPQVADDLRFALGAEIHVVVAPTHQIEDRIRKYYGADIANMEDVLAQLWEVEGVEYGVDQEEDIARMESEANTAPIIRYVDLILAQAIAARASDIHFEPFEKEFKIRYRVDGALYEMSPPPRHLALPVISRVKVMSNLNIAERRLPQDGRIQKMIEGRPIDLRVSTLPTQYGESVVLRVLDRGTVNLELEALGMPQRIFNEMVHAILKPNGIVIVTGPTGAGKTTTLYSALRRLNSIETKLLTAEDPVEYDLEGVIQVGVNENIGLSFARCLRAFLRQDPDRIMVGEMRDLETAQIAIQASLTGHLVLTTLHTNDAPGAITRLIDMGAEPFLISATLEAVLGQRLVRRICRDCLAPYEPTESVLSQLGLSPHDIGDKNFYYGRGCETCNHTGYRGRKGLFELLLVTDPIRDLINQRAPTVVIKQKAIEVGMITLREDGLRNIYDGETTIEEIIKYT